MRLLGEEGMFFLLQRESQQESQLSANMAIKPVFRRQKIQEEGGCEMEIFQKGPLKIM